MESLEIGVEVLHAVWFLKEQKALPCNLSHLSEVMYLLSPLEINCITETQANVFFLTI